jgi:hypothetical protein
MKRSDISDYEVCKAYVEMRKNWNGAEGNFAYPYDILSARFKCPEKVVYRAMERTYDRGLIECGVSLRTGWVTSKGETLLATYLGE